MISESLLELCFCGSISCFAGLSIDFVCPICCCVPLHSPVVCVSQAFVSLLHRWRHLPPGGRRVGGELSSAAGERAGERRVQGVEVEVEVEAGSGGEGRGA